MVIKKNIIIIGLLWIAVIIASLSWNLYAVLNNQEQQARLAARSFFDQVLITRQWNASHGGVYVPVTPASPPNPFLKDPHRDLLTDHALALTKINPAYMTRQIAEISREWSGTRFHITSLNPIRPDNRPDARELRHLQQFETGTTESGELVRAGGKQYYFYMAPLVTETACLQCHAEQGYREGEIRGGISVTLPFDVKSPLPILIASHLGIGLLGLAGLVLVGRQLTASYNTIKRQAAVDALTGIANRRSFTETITREFYRNRRDRGSLALLLCDIDSFKAYNDRYGHQAGDQCLIRVAATIVGALHRPGDFCARFGGEEFVVILPKTSLPGAQKVAERIRAHVEALAIEHRDAPTTAVVTISVGVAVLSDQDLQRYEQLVQQADRALYQAKEQGKNRVATWQDKAAAAD